MRSNSAQGSPTPGHQTASQVPRHRLIEGLELSGFRRGTKELISRVTPRPAQFSPRFWDRETGPLFALRSFPPISPFPAPTASDHISPRSAERLFVGCRWHINPFALCLRWQRDEILQYLSTALSFSKSPFTSSARQLQGHPSLHTP